LDTQGQKEPGEANDIACFVIGPIGDKDAEPGTSARLNYEQAVQVMEEVIEPACRGYGIPVTRADKIATPGEIPEQVFRRLRDTHLVIADLTGANPNVMYELGLRHTTGKLTIQIGERDRLPFDVSTIRTIQFKRTELGLVEARRRVGAAIGAGLERGGDPVAATRIWFEVSIPTVEVDEESEEDSAEAVGEEEAGFLEKIAEMMDGMESATATLGAVTTVFGEMGELAQRAAARINALNDSGGPASARVSVANGLAEALTEPANRLAVLAGSYSQSIDRMNPGMTYALLAAQKEENHEKAREFCEAVRTTISNAEESLGAMAELRASALEAGEATRSLRKVNRRIAQSLDLLVDSRKVFESWSELL